MNSSPRIGLLWLVPFVPPDDTCLLDGSFLGWPPSAKHDAWAGQTDQDFVDVSILRLITDPAILHGRCSSGSSARHVSKDRETDKALPCYMAAISSDIRPELQPSRELQRTLTQPLHALAIHWLMTHADEPTQQRLNSLTTPHALAWLSSTSFVSMITQGEFAAGLKWVSGVKFRDEWPTCPDCGRQADPFGLHAITCQRSGSISRGHTALRDAIGELFAKVGIPAVPRTTTARQPLLVALHSSCAALRCG